MNDDPISRQAAIDTLIRKMEPHNNGDGTMTICIMSKELVRETLNDLPSVQQEHGDEASFWKKRAREYEDIIADLVTAQAKGIKLDSIEITGEGIIFKKSQSERKTGKWK